MGQMTRHIAAAGSYAPVTILIQELAGGGTQVAYDTVASAIDVACSRGRCSKCADTPLPPASPAW